VPLVPRMTQAIISRVDLAERGRDDVERVDASTHSGRGRVAELERLCLGKSSGWPQCSRGRCPRSLPPCARPRPDVADHFDGVVRDGGGRPVSRQGAVAKTTSLHRRQQSEELDTREKRFEDSACWDGS
jgi:hypothetical protein